MSSIWQDVRYAVRVLRQQPGFAAIATLTLALGIGASTAIFSVIDAALLHPMPYPHPEQLVAVHAEQIQPNGRISSPTPSMEDLRRWQDAHDVFSSVAGWGRAFRGVIIGGPDPERVPAINVTEDYLKVFGVTPLIGRGITQDDTRIGAPPVVLLGYGFWKRRFGGAADVIGQTLHCDDELATIVGVLPASFDADTPLFGPLKVPLDEVPMRGTGRVSVYARLQPGVSIDAARQRLSAAMPALHLRNGTVLPVRVGVDSLLDTETGAYRTTVLVLSGAVALILLIACVNVAGLLLGRGAARQAELAVRASLGASRSRLIRQLLIESAVLAAAGAALGTLLATVSLGALVANIPMTLPENSPARVNWLVLALTAALVIPTSLVFGLAPALRLSSVRLQTALARSGRQAGASLSRRGGQVLIAAEVALAVVLVAGAGLMIRTFARISAVNLGFDADSIVTMDVLPLEGSPDAQSAYYDELLRRVRAIPGVSAAGAIDNFPLGGTTTFTSAGVGSDSTGVTMFQVLPGYFSTMAIPVRAGAEPGADQAIAGAHWALLSESAARKMFPSGPAVGREFTMPGRPEPWIVAAVVGDVRHGGPLARVRDEPQVYVPLRPAASGIGRNLAMTIVVRPVRSTPDLADRLRHAAQSAGGAVLVERIQTGGQWFGDRVVTPRRRLVLLGLLGALGLVLTLVGVFGMTAYAVSRRTQEIGIRMVFGASPRSVVGRSLRDSAVPIAIGIILGLGAASLATRAIASFLFQTAPIDPPAFAGVAVLLLLAGALAAWLPARRAARVDPVVALRAE